MASVNSCLASGSGGGIGSNGKEAMEKEGKAYLC